MLDFTCLLLHRAEEWHPVVSIGTAWHPGCFMNSMCQGGCVLGVCTDGSNDPQGTTEPFCGGGGSRAEEVKWTQAFHINHRFKINQKIIFDAKLDVI